MLDYFNFRPLRIPAVRWRPAPIMAPWWQPMPWAKCATAGTTRSGAVSRRIRWHLIKLTNSNLLLTQLGGFQCEEEEQAEQEQQQQQLARQSISSTSSSQPNQRPLLPHQQQYPHQQQLQQHELNDLIEPLAKLNSHVTSPSKQSMLRPKELPNLSSSNTSPTSATANCNNISPPSSHLNNSTHNANWNSDSWADGEFEPLDESGFGEFLTLTCLLPYQISLLATHLVNRPTNETDTFQAMPNWTRPDASGRRRSCSGSGSWRRDGPSGRAAPWSWAPKSFKSNQPITATCVA